MSIPNVSLNDPATSTWANAVADTVNGMIATDTYTPTLTNVAIGTGGSAANTAEWLYIGQADVGGRGVISITGTIALGTSGASVSGVPTVSLPSEFNLDPVVNSGYFKIGQCTFSPAGTGLGYAGVVHWASASTVAMQALGASTSYLFHVNPSASIPDTWTSGGIIRWHLNTQVVRV